MCSALRQSRHLSRPDGDFNWQRFNLLMRVVKLVSGTSIEALMLARHKGIDALLSRHIESGKVKQVIELACGLSPRGWRFAQRYGAKLTYVETDLPHMVQLKHGLLEKAELTPDLVYMTSTAVVIKNAELHRYASWVAKHGRYLVFNEPLYNLPGGGVIDPGSVPAAESLPAYEYPPRGGIPGSLCWTHNYRGIAEAAGDLSREADAPEASSSDGDKS